MAVFLTVPVPVHCALFLLSASYLGTHGHVDSNEVPVKVARPDSDNRVRFQRGQNKEHLQQHIRQEEELVDMDLDNLTEGHQSFFYFKMHDYDNNKKLDGIELIKALLHHDDHGDVDALTEDELDEFVRSVLAEDDINDDGYIDYFEFLKAQNRDGVDVEPVGEEVKHVENL